MQKLLRGSYLFVGLVALASAANAEEVGVSAVPFTTAPPRPAPQQSAAWQARTFSAPNGGLLVFRYAGVNPACASYDGRNCLWGQGLQQVRYSQVRPLVCGERHRSVWGVTGYEDRKHWCSVARAARSTNFD